ncbi:MAG TPA: hypothetical protein VJA27_02240 [Patescibacteria group bacterium]|nr:hypothetical protein [Patescibacteria group bacterium]
MEEKRSFFANLDPKSALTVGIVGGVLSLCTVGFLVTLGLVWNGTLELANGSSKVAATPTYTAPPATDTQPTLPPPQVPKAKKTKAELFVMSYCPFGLQMEKAYLPVMELLGKKADMDIKFVSYAMHDLKEVEENTRQYCIQSEQNNKFVDYMKCFTASGDTASCQASAGVSKTKMDSCVTKTNKQYAIMDKFNDQSTWLSGRYPVYPIHDALNTQYGVQGSPTFVINGVQAEVSRTPEAVKQAICAGFENPPEECNQPLSTASFDPGFGTTVSATGGAALAAGCGV